MSEPYERKSWDGDFQVTDETQGIVHAVVSVYGNVDAEGDIVHRGAFARDLAGGKAIPIVWSHDWKSPVGKTLQAWEGEDGFHVVAKFNLKTQRGAETFSDIAEGIINQYSFGYRPINPERKDGVRHIRELKLYEVSPVLHGMNDRTYTVSAKRLLGDGLPLEDYLAALGDEAQEALRRVQARAELRAKEGRVMSQANLTRLSAIADALHATSGEVRGFCGEMAPKEREPKGFTPAETLYLKFLDLQARMTGPPSTE